MKPYGEFDRGQDPADLAYEKLLQADHIEGNASYLQHTMMNTLVTERRVKKIIGKYKPQAAYPATKLGQCSDESPPSFTPIWNPCLLRFQGGYDTHAHQLNNYAYTTELSTSMSAFQIPLTVKTRGHDCLL